MPSLASVPLTGNAQIQALTTAIGLNPPGIDCCVLIGFRGIPTGNSAWLRLAVLADGRCTATGLLAKSAALIAKEETPSLILSATADKWDVALQNVPASLLSSIQEGVFDAVGDLPVVISKLPKFWQLLSNLSVLAPTATVAQHVADSAAATAAATTAVTV